ncbi:putative reverse transcriptase, RNA-dependent DNA polymerase [Arabidopsis thaliana]
MKDLGKLKYFLGIDVSRGRNGFDLSQLSYALDIINDVGLICCKPSVVPMELNQKLVLVASLSFHDPHQY